MKKTSLDRPVRGRFSRGICRLAHRWTVRPRPVAADRGEKIRLRGAPGEADRGGGLAACGPGLSARPDRVRKQTFHESGRPSSAHFGRSRCCQTHAGEPCFRTGFATCARDGGVISPQTGGAHDSPGFSECWRGGAVRRGELVERLQRNRTRCRGRRSRAAAPWHAGRGGWCLPPARREPARFSEPFHILATPPSNRSPASRRLSRKTTRGQLCSG